MIYVHRYLRLTPLLIAVVLFSITLLRFFGSGPLWPMLTNTISNQCEKYWWSTLLYIQNYENPTEICVSHVLYTRKSRASQGGRSRFVFNNQFRSIKKCFNFPTVDPHLVFKCWYAAVFDSSFHHFTFQLVQYNNDTCLNCNDLWIFCMDYNCTCGLWTEKHVCDWWFFQHWQILFVNLFITIRFTACHQINSKSRMFRRNSEQILG